MCRASCIKLVVVSLYDVQVVQCVQLREGRERSYYYVCLASCSKLVIIS